MEVVKGIVERTNLKVSIRLAKKAYLKTLTTRPHMPSRVHHTQAKIFLWNFDIAPFDYHVKSKKKTLL